MDIYKSQIIIIYQQQKFKSFYLAYQRFTEKPEIGHFLLRPDYAKVHLSRMTFLNSSKLLHEMSTRMHEINLSTKAL